MHFQKEVNVSRLITIKSLTPTLSLNSQGFVAFFSKKQCSVPPFRIGESLCRPKNLDGGRTIPRQICEARVASPTAAVFAA